MEILYLLFIGVIIVGSIVQGYRWARPTRRDRYQEQSFHKCVFNALKEGRLKDYFSGDVPNRR